MVIREALTGQHLQDALRLAEIGKTDLQEWSDVREPGLRLRVRRRNATWVLKYGSSTVTLGPANRWTVGETRKMGSHIRAMLKSGLDPRPWVDARLAGATAEEAAGVVLRRVGREKQEWKLATLMERYRDDHIKVGRVVRGKRRAPSKKTLNDVEIAIRQKQFVDISDLLLRELDERALENYRNKLLRQHGGSASRKGLAYVKAALSWARKHHSAEAGLVGVSQWWRDVANLHVEKTKDRLPSIEDLGMTIALAEIVRRLPGRSINSRTSDTTLKALWMMVLTAQRREAVISTEVSELITDEREGGGWGLLYRPPHVMKSRREHVLPIPPRAMNMIEGAVAASRSAGSNWLFPATRIGKNGEINHMDGSSVNKLLERLRGADEKSQSATMPNLLILAGIEEPNWSPHDARNTFATMVEDWTTRGDAVSAVLDHEGLGSDGISRGAASITRTAYSQSQRLGLKRIAMEPWCNAIIDAVEAARPRAIELIANLGRACA